MAPDPILCPICGAPAVRELTVIIPAIGWGGPHFDVDGRRHTHDPNGTGVLYFCANKHDFEGEGCWCGWRRYQPPPQP